MLSKSGFHSFFRRDRACKEQKREFISAIGVSLFFVTTIVGERRRTPYLELSIAESQNRLVVSAHVPGAMRCR